jgi:DNA-directed RNA polymerase subunit beta'
MKIETIEQVYNELKKENVQITDKYKYENIKKGITEPTFIELGKIWFNLLLPENYPFIYEQQNSKSLKKIIDDLIEKYDSEIVEEVVTKINKEGYYISTFYPISASINSFILSNSLKEEKKKKLEDEENAVEFNNKTDSIAKKHLDNLKNKDDGLYYISASGSTSKASSSNIATLLVAKGASVNIEGEATKPIKSSITDGFTLKEFYENASESRAAFFIRSSATADPGDLARDAAFANSNIVISLKDCKTKKYFILEVTEKNINQIFGRYYVEGDEIKKIEKGKEKEIIGKQIKLRSPLYCKDPDGICELCYGDLWKKLETKHIGLLISQIINTKGQSITMSARHQSSQVKLQEVDFTKQFIK